MLQKQVERVIQSLQTEIAVRLAAREVVLILAQKIAEHVESISDIRSVHFSTRQTHEHNDATTNSKFEPPVL
jgi:hypothetical protein